MTLGAAEDLLDFVDEPAQNSRIAMVVWIKSTRHRHRRRTALGRMTPIEFGTLSQTALAV